MKIETGKLYFLPTTGVCECLGVQEKYGEPWEVRMRKVSTGTDYTYFTTAYIRAMVLREATVADIERTIDNNRLVITRLYEQIEDARKYQERLDAWRDRL